LSKPKEYSIVEIGKIETQINDDSLSRLGIGTSITNKKEMTDLASFISPSIPSWSNDAVMQVFSRCK